MHCAITRMSGRAPLTADAALGSKSCAAEAVAARIEALEFSAGCTTFDLRHTRINFIGTLSGCLGCLCVVLAVGSNRRHCKRLDLLHSERAYRRHF